MRTTHRSPIPRPASRRWLGGLLAGLLAPVAGASTFVPVPFAERVERAELIVDATVAAIEHRNSDVVEPGDVEVPHTFVTFRVEDVVKGRHDGGDTLTLRFVGGPDGEGGTTRIVGLPRFQVGDREILFVRKNGERMCPLVGWHQGRLRVIRDAVYDDAGARLWVGPEGQLARGEERVDLTRTGYPARIDEPTGTEPRRIVALPEGSTPPDRQGMLAVLDHMVRQQRATNPAPSELVRSVSIGESFRAPSLLRRAPAARSVGAAGTEPGDS